MLTPFGKITNMAILEKRHFYSLETLSFYLEQKETQLLGSFLPKTKKNKISIFRLKPWVNPFRKIINTATLEKQHVSSLESLSFYFKRNNDYFQVYLD